MNWNVITTEYLFQQPPYFVARKDVCKRPDGVIIPAYYVVELPASVITFGITEDEQVLFTEQYRHPIGEVSLELPGGFIETGEEPVTAAQRETEEETGYQFSNYFYIGTVAGNPGILNNRTHLFVATGGKKVTEQQMDDQEDITVTLLSINKVIHLMEERKIIQSLHLNACFYAMLHLNKLKFLQ
ncbi:MAG TPA: NUDIX hydrolase [Lacibacter sp.]|nr:NUDIX hydrolase [Lacibacter sp.]